MPRSVDKRGVYAVWTNKGGVGKTTLSFHISTTFAEQFFAEGWKVLVCDLCPQANISITMLTPQQSSRKTSTSSGSDDQLQIGEDVVDMFCRTRLRPDFEIYCTVAGYIQSFVSRKAAAKVPPEEFLVRPCEHNAAIPENVYLLCGDPELGVSCERLEQYRRSDPGGEGEEPWRESTLALREFVDKACDGVDPDANWLVIIDTNPALTTYTQLALVAADQIIMPVNADDFSKVAVKALFDLLYGTEEVYQRFSSIRKLTFAYKVKEYNVPLPRVRLVVNNRQTIYSTRACRPFGFIGEMISDTLFKLFKKHPDRFVGGKELMQAQRDEELSKRFVSTYTADLKDFHSTGVVCIHLGVPISVIASGKYQRLPDFKNVSKQQGEECHRSVIKLCVQMLRPTVQAYSSWEAWPPPPTDPPASSAPPHAFPVPLAPPTPALLPLTQKQTMEWPTASTAAFKLSPSAPVPTNTSPSPSKLVHFNTTTTSSSEQSPYESPAKRPRVEGSPQQTLSSVAAASAGSELVREGFPNPGSVTVLKVFEKDLPYSSVYIQSSEIGEDGGRLCAGGVTALYHSGTLPVGTQIGMVVAEIEDGFKIDGKFTISPQVTLTTRGQLAAPVELMLPLEHSERDFISVRMSETQWMEPLSWKELPPSDFSVLGNHVVVKTTHNTIYQALSGPDDLEKIHIIGELVYFSLQQRPLAAKKSLCLLFSDKKGECSTLKKEHLHLVPNEEALQIRNPPGLDLQVQLKALDGSIVQRTTPYSLSHINEPLDETFFLRITRSNEGPFSHIKNLIPFLRRLPINKSWTWMIEAASSHQKLSHGTVTVCAGKFCDTAENFKQISDHGVQMSFALNWQQVEDIQRGPGKREQSTQGAITGPTPSSGTTAADLEKTLKPGGTLFGDIAKSFSNINDVYSLADALLEGTITGIAPRGGTEWVKAKTAPGAVPNPQENAHEVLRCWYDYSSDKPSGSKLHTELRKILPRVAEEFEKDLLYPD